MTDEQTNHPGSNAGEDDPIRSQDMEALTPEEMDQFLANARNRGAALSQEERSAIGGQGSTPTTQAETVDVTPERLAQLMGNFFPELGDPPPPQPLVCGVLFDFDNTLARLIRPHRELMEEGARSAEAYLRSTGMTLPEDFWTQIVEARIFAETKSDDEQEEHIADDALSFLLQFYGYPASRLDRDVLSRAVDLFYAPEMVAWQPLPGAQATLEALRGMGYRLGVLTNYSCDRVFQRMVDYTGLRPYLDLCVCSASVEWRKPGKDIFGIALTQWDVLPYELVVVGDSLKHDIGGGIDLGALTVHCRMVPRAEDVRVQERIRPDAAIDDLGQLPALIRAWT